MRQTVRLNEVRAPRTPTDTLTPADVLATDAQAVTLEDHYSGVLTQIKNALGTPTWRNLPPDNLANLASFRTDTGATLAAQATTLTAQNQALAAQAASITALTATAQEVSALRLELQAIQANLANLSGGVANQADLAALAQQVGAMDAALSAQVAQLASQVSTLANQAATDHSRIGALENQSADYVTATGLTQALITAYVVDTPLSGVQNRINLSFYTPSPFVAGTLRIHYNGQSLRQGPAGDYIVASSQPGLPYDSIRLLHAEAAPYAQDVLTATYIPA